ncbi:DinB family protein [Virgibacillus sp. YIM 98842]|uniref:DinB family protein n=1 Tax=Virgibacillus sp. YIM 98842 TaxID=2663533 RepID=UPI0013D95590|nr:DinB family protein [Virgibacillus sp. YIM 98842]
MNVITIIDGEMFILKSEKMDMYFNQLKIQRETFYHDTNLNFAAGWTRPISGKWSIGETLYHLVLMTRLFRRISNFYIPAMLPVAYARKNKPYPSETYNIYAEYYQKKNRAMKAPSVINPPSGIEKKWNITEVQWFLEYETEKFYSLCKYIDENIAGQIYYPDPIAHNPNLIQSIHLLAIHEQHHFDLTKKYYLDRR